MKTLLLASLLVPSLAFADAGYTEKKVVVRHAPMLSGFYIKAEGGLSKAKFNPIAQGVSHSSKNSLALGLGGGYTINEFFSTDLMLGYRNLHIKGDSKVRLYSAMLNGYVTAHNDTIFTPYLMAGVGVNKGKFKAGAFKATQPDAVGNTVSINGKSKTNFMWNLGAGVRAKVADQVDVDLSYRYVNFGKSKVAGTKITEVAATNVTAAFAKGVKTTANEFMAGVIFRL